MDAENTDKLIARAIAALPYRSPSAGFAARVMAEIAEAEVPLTWGALVLKCAVLTVAIWGATLVFVAGRLVVSNLAEIAAFLIQPGSLSRAADMLSAGAALVFVKAASVYSFMAGLADIAAPVLPGWRETAAAALLASAAIAAVAKGGQLSVNKARI